MSKYLIDDISKIYKLIHEQQAFKDHTTNIDNYMSIQPIEQEMSFYTTKEYTATSTDDPEGKIIIKKDTIGTRKNNIITIYPLTYKCGDAILTKTNLTNAVKSYIYNSPDLIKVLKNVCSWTMDSYRKLPRKSATTTKPAAAKSTKKKTVDYLKSEQCAKACNDRYPYYSVICDGGKWKSTLKSWIAEKGGGEDKETYRALRTSWCSGWRPGQTQQATTDFVAPVFTTTTTVLPQNFGSDAIL
jgi:hypothetical protein